MPKLVNLLTKKLISEPEPGPTLSPEEVQIAPARILAVNIADLLRLPDVVREAAFRDEHGTELLDRSSGIMMDKERRDEDAVTFSCDLLRAACLCDWLRSCDMQRGAYPSRVYVKREKSWNKQPGSSVLTVMIADKVRLNPAIFTSTKKQSILGSSRLASLKPKRIY